MNGFSLSPAFTPIPQVKFYFNLGGTLDIPTGEFKIGKYGESILNGGLGPITGIVAIGNSFKTTLLYCLMLIVMSRYEKSTANTYDTETQVQLSRLKRLASYIEGFNKEDIIENERWVVTDKTIYFANEWYEVWRKFILDKIENKSKLMEETPFLDKDKKTLLKMVYPTFSQVDSLSEFETQDVANMQKDNELGDSGALTIYMKQGLSKKRFLADIPKYVSEANNPMMLTAQIGKDIVMDQRAPPVKKLQFLKNGDKIKGVPDGFVFLTSVCYQILGAVPFTNDTTKAPEYPRSSEDDMKGDTDLILLTVVTLRNKNGPTGLISQLLVSQREGFLPTLTEFHYIKTNDRFGFEGNVQNYTLALLPEVKLSRTTIRSKIDSNPLLRRAINITSEMCQMKHLYDNLEPGLICTPKELYDDLKAQGYDWNVLLATRGWWIINNDKHPIPFLSTMDLLNMHSKFKKYFPYWMNEDKTIKTVKPKKV